MAQNRTVGIRQNVINETAIQAANFISSVYPPIMIETLSVRPSLHLGTGRISFYVVQVSVWVYALLPTVRKSCLHPKCEVTIPWPLSIYIVLYIPTENQILLSTHEKIFEISNDCAEGIRAMDLCVR
jgi:hypothetical protein